MAQFWHCNFHPKLVNVILKLQNVLIEAGLINY